MYTPDDERSWPMPGGERRDDEHHESASVERATAKLWTTLTGQQVPTGDSARYDSFRDTVEAIVSAAGVRACQIAYDSRTKTKDR